MVSVYSHASSQCYACKLVETVQKYFQKMHPYMGDQNIICCIIFIRIPSDFYAFSFQYSQKSREESIEYNQLSIMKIGFPPSFIKR